MSLPLGACAGVAGAVASECAGALLQGVADVCCDAALSAVCESDDDPVTGEPDDEPVAELPPPPPREPMPEVAPCATRELPGSVWRIDCVDGTVAEAIAPPEAGSDPPATADGAIRITGLADIERLANLRGLAGSLVITGPALLRLELPSLRHVDGDLAVENTTQLSTLRLGALVQVDGAFRLLRNRSLRGDPCPALLRAGSADVAFNDVLQPVVVDRLLSLAPPPPPLFDNGD